MAAREPEKAGFTMRDWSKPMLLKAGEWAMNILLETMPDVFVLTDLEGMRSEREWTITDEALNKCHEAVAEIIRKSPVYQPRTEAPVDWKDFYANVAEDDRTLAGAPLFRTHNKDTISSARHAVRTGTMKPALRGLNVLQSVPWKINGWLLDVLIDCYNAGIKVEGLPARELMAVPPKLSQEEWKKLDPRARRVRARTRKGRVNANKAIKSDTMQLMEDIEIAQRFAPVPAFYTPMSMDWRSRVYGLTHFNFQREDKVRALFLFAEGEAIGEEGIYWLKLHVANCGDFNKVSKAPFEERIKWVDDNLMLIRDYVKRPTLNTGWTEADSPFLFLAACGELIAALTNGPAHVSHLPVSWDGACNGLQHLCSMTRAPEGRYVNLTDNLSPEDVYQLVATKAKAVIEADLTNEEMFGKPNDEAPERKTYAPVKELARIALAYGVDRSLCKRNVMTFAYASKEYGMADQHYEDTMEPLELKLIKGDIDNHPFGDSVDEWRLCCRYLAKRVLAAIREVVGLPAKAMEFMQLLAGALAHEGKPLKWTTPAGVPWINRYSPVITERVELFLHDKGVKSRQRITVAVDSENSIDKDKAKAGVAANVTHACDASHLLLTVNACADEGIVDIATVHDSFGCLPSRAGRFNQIIRETFLRMYTDHDVLAELLASARADMSEAGQWRLDEAEAAMPAKGTLNLEEILNAKYAFA
jgi:DNA-directed RNA polymerase